MNEPDETFPVDPYLTDHNAWFLPRKASTDELSDRHFAACAAQWTGDVADCDCADIDADLRDAELERRVDAARDREDD